MRKLVRIVTVNLAMLFLVSLNSMATNYYVNDALTTGDIYTTVVGTNANNGLTAATPKATLTNVWNTYGPAGTNVITSGDVIFIDAGTFLSTESNLALSVSGISIIGAGSSLTFFNNNQVSADANRWANVTGNNITLQGFYLTGYNFGSGGASTLNISGVTNLTVTGVEVNENAAGGGSSAIVISGGSTVSFSGGGSNCNPGAPSVAGGGMNVEGNGNIVTIDDYTFSGNTKDLQGGSGLYVSGDNTTTVTVTNSLIVDNVNTSASGGAAIFVSGSNLNLTGCCINGNQVNSGSGPKYGGAISVARGATLVISDCSFTGNAISNSGKGGAIAINTSFSGSGSAASVSLTSCSFTGNTASTEGNHLYARVGSGHAASFSITECSFSATAEDIRQDNSATFTIQNSGTPVISGTGITMVNFTPPVTTPSTTCPVSVGPCYTILLPVELINFSAACVSGKVELYWSTASERENDYFMIERAGEDGIFESIGVVSGMGNSQELNHYSLKDYDAKDAISYYRLTQVDFNGHREVFSIISAKTCGSDSELTLSYSSGEKILHTHLPIGSKGAVHFQLYSVLGVLVYENIIQPSSTDRLINFSLPENLAMGTFICKVSTENQLKSLNLFIH
jgi:hypothetical protein